MKEINELMPPKTLKKELRDLERSYRQDRVRDGSAIYQEVLEHVNTLFESLKIVMEFDFQPTFGFSNIVTLGYKHGSLIKKAQTARDHLEKLKISDEKIYRLGIYVLKLNNIVKKFLNGNQKIPDLIKNHYPENSIAKLQGNLITFHQCEINRKNNIINKASEYIKLDESLQKVFHEKNNLGENPNFTELKKLIDIIDNLHKECSTKKNELASLSQESLGFPDSLPDYKNEYQEIPIKTPITTSLLTATSFLEKTEPELETTKRALIEKMLDGENSQLIHCQLIIDSALNECSKFEVINNDPQDGEAQEDQAVRAKKLESQKKALDNAHEAIENNISVLKKQKQKLKEMRKRGYPAKQEFIDLQGNLTNADQKIEENLGLMQEKLAEINTNRTKVELLLQKNVQDQVAVLVKDIQDNITVTLRRIEKNLTMNEQEINDLNAEQEKLNGEQNRFEISVTIKKESNKNNKLFNNLEIIKKKLEKKHYIPFSRIGRIYEFNTLLSLLDLRDEELKKWQEFYQETTGNVDNWKKYSESWKKYVASYFKGQTSEKNKNYCEEFIGIIQNNIDKINEKQNRELKNLEEQKKELDVQINNLQRQQIQNVNNKTQLQQQKSNQEKRQNAISQLQTLTEETQKLTALVEQGKDQLKKCLEEKDIQIYNETSVKLGNNNFAATRALGNKIICLKGDLQKLVVDKALFDQSELNFYNKSLSLLDENISEQNRLLQVQLEILNLVTKIQQADNELTQLTSKVDSVASWDIHENVTREDLISQLSIITKNDESTDLQQTLKFLREIAASLEEKFELKEKIHCEKGAQRDELKKILVEYLGKKKDTSQGSWLKNLFTPSHKLAKERYVESLQKAIQGYVQTGPEEFLEMITEARQQLKSDLPFQKALVWMEDQVLAFEHDINATEALSKEHVLEESESPNGKPEEEESNCNTLNVEFETKFNQYLNRPIQRFCLFSCINTKLVKKKDIENLKKEILIYVENGAPEQLLQKIGEFRKLKIDNLFEKILAELVNKITAVQNSVQRETLKQNQQQEYEHNRAALKLKR
jgi:hypothetical protein